MMNYSSLEYIAELEGLSALLQCQPELQDFRSNQKCLRSFILTTLWRRFTFGRSISCFTVNFSVRACNYTCIRGSGTIVMFITVPEYKIDCLADEQKIKTSANLRSIPTTSGHSLNLPFRCGLRRYLDPVKHKLFQASLQIHFAGSNMSCLFIETPE